MKQFNHTINKQTNKQNEPTVNDHPVSTGQSNILQEDPINQKRELAKKILQEIYRHAQLSPTLARQIEATIRKFKDKHAPQMQELKDLKAQYDRLLQQNTVTSEFVDLYTDRLNKFLEILDTFKKKLYLAIEQAVEQQHQNQLPEDQINQKREHAKKILQEILSFAQRFPTQAKRIEATIRKFKDKHAPQMQELKDLKAQYDRLLQQNTVTSEFVDLYTDRLNKFLEILDTFKKKLYLAIEQAIEQQHQNQLPRESSLAQRLAKAMQGSTLHRLS